MGSDGPSSLDNGFDRASKAEKSALRKIQMVLHTDHTSSLRGEIKKEADALLIIVNELAAVMQAAHAGKQLLENTRAWNVLNHERKIVPSTATIPSRITFVSPPNFTQTVSWRQTPSPRQLFAQLVAFFKDPSSYRPQPEPAQAQRTHSRGSYESFFDDLLRPASAESRARDEGERSTRQTAQQAEREAAAARTRTTRERAERQETLSQKLTEFSRQLLEDPRLLITLETVHLRAYLQGLAPQYQTAALKTLSDLVEKILSATPEVKEALYGRSLIGLAAARTRTEPLFAHDSKIYFLFSLLTRETSEVMFGAMVNASQAAKERTQEEDARSAAETARQKTQSERARKELAIVQREIERTIETEAAAGFRLEGLGARVARLKNRSDADRMRNNLERFFSGVHALIKPHSTLFIVGDDAQGDGWKFDLNQKRITVFVPDTAFGRDDWSGSLLAMLRNEVRIDSLYKLNVTTLDKLNSLSRSVPHLTVRESVTALFPNDKDAVYNLLQPFFSDTFAGKLLQHPLFSFDISITTDTRSSEISFLWNATATGVQITLPRNSLASLDKYSLQHFAVKFLESAVKAQIKESEGEPDAEKTLREVLSVVYQCRLYDSNTVPEEHRNESEDFLRKLAEVFSSSGVPTRAQEEPYEVQIPQFSTPSFWSKILVFGKPPLDKGQTLVNLNTMKAQIDAPKEVLAQAVTRLRSRPLDEERFPA